MKTMHLFAGAGGGLLSDLILGHDPIVAVEWDAYCCQVLRERAAEGWFPELQVFEGDVRLFDPSEYKGRVDIVAGGFPCQDISVAGNCAGVGEDTRSGLYREILRIADVVRPKFLFLENVSAILNNGMGTVLGDLAARGYDARWCCLRASDVGANHQRDRWWLLAYTQSGTRQRETPREAGHTSLGGENLADSTGQQCEWSVGTRTGREGLANRGWWDASLPVGGVADELATGVVRRGWWEEEPEIGRVTKSEENRAKKLKALGNGQVPIQAAAAFRILMEGFEKQ